MKVKYTGARTVELVDETGIGQKVEPGAEVDVTKAQADELLAVHPQVNVVELRPAGKGRPAETREEPNPMAGKPCRPDWKRVEGTKPKPKTIKGTN